MQEGLAAAADERSSRAASARTGRRDRATEKRREAAAQLVAQSVREIFRKLASALHPDRELDPTRRDAKTALMQKVNQAYAANDLLGLLELQLQVAQIDAGHLASVGAERLKQFNQALSNQLNALKAELARVETELRISTGMQPGFRLTPESLLKTIDRSVTAMRADLAMQKREMRMLADRAATRHWLKLERKRRRDDPFDLAF